jgi:hypothetical protein
MHTYVLIDTYYIAGAFAQGAAGSSTDQTASVPEVDLITHTPNLVTSGTQPQSTPLVSNPSISLDNTQPHQATHNTPLMQDQLHFARHTLWPAVYTPLMQEQLPRARFNFWQQETARRQTQHADQNSMQTTTQRTQGQDSIATDTLRTQPATPTTSEFSTGDGSGRGMGVDSGGAPVTSRGNDMGEGTFSASIGGTGILCMLTLLCMYHTYLLLHMC